MCSMFRFCFSLILAAIPVAAFVQPPLAYRIASGSISTCKQATVIEKSPTNELLNELSPLQIERVVQLAALQPLQQQERPITAFVIANSLGKWKKALLNGYLPEMQEDHLWPDPYLTDELCRVFSQLDLPRLTGRHQELVTPVLTALLEIALTFEKRVTQRDEKLKSIGKEDIVDENSVQYWEELALQELLEQSQSQVTPMNEGDSEESPENPMEFRQNLAAELARQFASAWSPPLGGLATLDELYGSDHGLLSPGGQDDIGGGAGEGRGGFGLFDGVWKHTGWVQIKQLQRQLRGMHELRSLIRSLGRRPTVDGKDMKKTPPQRERSDAPLGVARSAFAPVETYGIRKSDVIEGIYHTLSTHPPIYPVNPPTHPPICPINTPQTFSIQDYCRRN